MRWDAYPRVQNFLLFLIGNGEFQQTSTVCTFTAYSHCVQTGAVTAIPH